MTHRIFVMLVASLFALSCAGGDRDPITNPSVTPDQRESFTQGGPTSHQLWGFWSVRIDPETLTAEAAPLRGAEFTCNVTRFMQPPISPVNMISLDVLPSSNPLEGYFDVDVTVRHPFPSIPFYRGFDVRGILIANGSYQTNHDPDAVYGGDGDTQLVNADGLTRWWNPTEFTTYETIFGFTHGKLAPNVFPTATLNGYKYFADALDVDQPLWELDTATRGTFPTLPGVYSRLYSIQFAMIGGQVDFTFNYAVDASWDAPDPDGAPDYDIEYYPLSANMMEPYCLSVVDNGSTAYYASPTDNGGELKLAIRVYDWQASADPLGVAGEIAAIWLESTVLPSPIDVLPTAIVLPDGPTSSVFEVSIGDLNLTKSGAEQLLVFAQGADEFGYEPQVPGGPAFAHPDAPLGAYLMTSVNIASQGGQAPIVTAIDPDSAKSGDQLTGVIVTGQYFIAGAQVELRHPDWPAISADNEVVGGGGTSITCDLDLDAAAEGYWDVAVINPDLLEGILEGGFLVSCAEELHTYENKYYLTGGLAWNYCQRGDLTILETGAHAGECVVKRNYDMTSDANGYYVRFDPDNPSDTAATDFFSLPGKTDAVNTYITMCGSIDQNPVNGDMAVINGRMFDVVQMVDENGSHFEDVTITDPQTPLNYIPTIPGIDFDAEGDMWVVTNVKGIPDETGNPIWQLRHYELQSSSPYYVENTADRLDISEDLYDPAAQPYGHMWYVADIAVSYEEDSLFVFSASISGWNHSLFTKYDLSTSPPEWVENKDLLTSIVYCTNPYSKISRADIEFDHGDASVENCRLLVMYQTWDGSVRCHLMRMDTDFNVLNDDVVGPAFGAWDNPHAIAFNTDAEKRNLIGIDMEMSQPWNDFYYFSMPASGW